MPPSDLTNNEPTESEPTTDTGRLGLLYPEYGPIESLLGFGLFYLLLDTLTPHIVTTLTGPFPDLVPEPVTTATAALLWLVGITTLLAIALTQLDANPHTFTDQDARATFLDQHRPTEPFYTRSLGLLVLGGATAYLTWDTTITYLEGLLPVVVDTTGEFPGVMTIENTVVFVLFFVGFAAYARGLDRLIIGGIREFLYRSLDDDWS